MVPGTTLAERVAHDLVGRAAGDPLTDELAAWLSGSARISCDVDSMPRRFAAPSARLERQT